MSRYLVISAPAADRELAAIWNESGDRHAIAQASDNADQLLADDPLANGQHLGEELWVLRSPPLRFYYAISEENEVVVITDIRLEATD